MKVNSYRILITAILLTIVTSNTYVPIIAIVSIPDPSDQIDIQRTNVMGHYIRWIESAGGLTMAIHPWTSDTELDEILTKVNGFLWQGGGKDLDLNGQFELFSAKILNKIIDLKDKKNISIPLWVTCQGFELLNMIFAGTHDVLSKFDANNISSPLIFNQTVIENSRMYSFFSKQDLQNLRTMNTTAHFHHWGTTPEQFEQYPLLKNFFRVTSFAQGFDKNNTSIESYEAYDYDIYGVQYHPEKVSSDYKQDDDIPQSPEAIRVSSNLAVYFVNQCKKNPNVFTLDDRKKYDFIDMYQTKFVEVYETKVTYYYKNGTKFYDNYDVNVDFTGNGNGIKFLE